MSNIVDDWNAYRSAIRYAVSETEEAAHAAINFDYGVKDWADDGDPINAHIARHDPAAVLRRCAADRDIMDWAERADAWKFDESYHRGSMPDPDELVAAVGRAYGLEPPA